MNDANDGKNTKIALMQSHSYADTVSCIVSTGETIKWTQVGDRGAKQHRIHINQPAESIRYNEVNIVAMLNYI